MVTKQRIEEERSVFEVAGRCVHRDVCSEKQAQRREKQAEFELRETLRESHQLFYPFRQQFTTGH